MKKAAFLLCLCALLSSSAISRAFSTSGFQNPYGVVVDGNTGFIYVSNVNGDPNARDDNGFISRLKGDGTVDQMKFIDGAVPEFTLHAPKGMAIVGTTLYVADIDKLHAFDISTARFLFDINFGDFSIQHFYDIAPAPDNALYVTDGPAGFIYRVDVPKMHEVTTFASGDQLGQPHGICWYPAKQVFMVAGWSSGQVIALDFAGKRQATPGIFLRTLEGLRADNTGNLFVASTSLTSVYRISPTYAVSSFVLRANQPSGIAFQGAGNQIIVASFDAGTVQSYPILNPNQ
ncbi:MAG: hypothetical protein V2A66_01015 [Pseudomonadota bacterium]